MKIDETDIKILKLLDSTKKNTSITRAAREILQPKTDYDLRKADSFIRARVQKMLDGNLLQAFKEEDRTYIELNSRNVVFGTSKIVMKTKNKRKFTLDMGESVAVKGNGKWNYIQL